MSVTVSGQLNPAQLAVAPIAALQALSLTRFLRSTSSEFYFCIVVIYIFDLSLFSLIRMEQFGYLLGTTSAVNANLEAGMALQYHMVKWSFKPSGR